MPTAIRNVSRRHGIEKKVPKHATAHPAAITSMNNGTGGDDPANREVCADRREPEQAAGADQEHNDAGIHLKRGVEAGGKRPADPSADCAESADNVPSQT
jgi:hypothetical protein